MIKKLGGEDDTSVFPLLLNPSLPSIPLLCLTESASRFLSYRTSQYKLHYYETPTNVKFVMLTDVKSGSMRIALHQIYVSIYVEYVVKNALSPVEHPGGKGVDCELFEVTLEQFVVSVALLLFVFDLGLKWELTNSDRVEC